MVNNLHERYQFNDFYTFLNAHIIVYVFINHHSIQQSQFTFKSLFLVSISLYIFHKRSCVTIRNIFYHI